MVFSIIFFVLFLDQKEFLWLIGVFACFLLLFFLGEIKKAGLALFLIGISALLVWTIKPDLNHKQSIFEGKVVESYPYGFFLQTENAKFFIKGKSLEIDSWVKIKGILNALIVQKKENSSFILYLKSKSIFYEIVNSQVIENHNSTNFISTIKKYIFSGSENYSKLIPMVFLGSVTEDANFLKSNLIYLGVYHLFVISGFHINFFKQIIFWVFQKLKVKTVIYKPIFFAFLVFQSFLLNFPISFLRGVIFWVLIEINEIFLNKKFSKSTLLSWTMLILMGSNIFIIYSPAFILSFGVSFIILFINQIKFTKKWIKILVNFVFVNLTSFVYSAFYNSFYNLFSPFILLIFSPFFTIFYIILLFFLWNKEILEIISKYFVEAIEFIRELPFLILNLKINQTWLFFSNIIFLICFLFMEMTTSSSKRKLKQL